jgi:thiol:disulfide interchange protein
LLGFLGGLIALLTPCVFPMIPVTVSFFTKRAKSRKQAIRNGALYGFFIFLIYVLASVPFHVLGNVQPEIFNNISTNAWLNILFFIIFIFFAISFFGFFELTLPSGIASKADAKSGLGSIGGIFFMALTLAIVSFSCTGPILGSLLVGSLSGGAWPLTAGLAGFGLALALPFALFAIFPEWLQSLPKSGGWLDTVKKVLAFIELALAFKFLSNADLVMHWGILKREVFIGIWILISAGLTLYLFGLLLLPHDYKGMKIGTGRKVLGVIALLFTVYLIPGVTTTKYANLQLLSGFPPPFSYSIYGKDNVHGKGLEANVVNDYAKALQLSKEQHKPILIDFTGWACVNCRKMEENVWTKPEVGDYIRENFILVSLYVDDRANLPAEARIMNYKTSNGDMKDIITAGDKWATFQTENFNQTTQPLYVILNNGEQLMNHPVGYTPDVTEYRNWLECGKKAFDKSSQ